MDRGRRTHQPRSSSRQALTSNSRRSHLAGLSPRKSSICWTLLAGGGFQERSFDQWLRTGKSQAISVRASLEDPTVTHSICASHMDQLLEDLPSRSFPDVATLIVVRPNDTALFESLQGCSRV